MDRFESTVEDDGEQTCILCKSEIPKGELIIAPTPKGPKAVCSERHEAVIWRKTHPKRV